jgi:hypothetical protein
LNLFDYLLGGVAPTDFLGNHFRLRLANNSDFRFGSPSFLNYWYWLWFWLRNYFCLNRSKWKELLGFSDWGWSFDYRFGDSNDDGCYRCDWRSRRVALLHHGCPELVVCVVCHYLLTW